MAGKSRTGRAKQKETAQRYNMTVPERNPFEETEEHYYKRLAKRADDRLRALEKLAASGDPHFKGVLEYAYKNAQYDTDNIRGRARFGITLPRTKDGTINKMEFNRRMNAIKRFLESPTSTKQGIIRVYQRRTDTTNKEYGTNFTWQELANYYESAAAEKNAQKYGSDTIVQSLGAIRRIANDPEKIAAAAAGTYRVAKDDLTNTVAQAMLADGLDLSMFK